LLAFEKSQQEQKVFSERSPARRGGASGAVRKQSRQPIFTTNRRNHPAGAHPCSTFLDNNRIALYDISQ